MTDLREHRTQAIVKQSLFHADAHAVTEVPGYRGPPNGALSDSPQRIIETEATWVYLH